MVQDIFRDSTLGQIINHLSEGRLLPYDDQRPGFALPARYQAAINGNDTNDTTPSEDRNLAHGSSTVSPTATLVGVEAMSAEYSASDLEKAAASRTVVRTGDLPSPGNPFVVEWEENDQDNPRNWSFGKRAFVAFLISLLTFSVYVGSAIYAPSIPGIEEQFGVSQVAATAGLTLFVFFYGVGPMFLAPLQDMPKIGRNPVYILGLALFVIFQFPIIYAKNIGTILVFRALSGFFGSPALATGGASMLDIFPPSAAAIAIGVWSIGAVLGPIAGPILASYAAQTKGWTWPIWELLWISGFALVFLALALPETLESNILVKRAARIRKLTGDNRFRAQAEIDATEGEHWYGLLWINFKRAIQLSLEPAVFFSNIYITIVYSILYLWFEAFPLVFGGIYNFGLGATFLPNISFVVSGMVTFVFYILYQLYYMNPRMAREGGSFQPEARLELGVVAGLTVPISLLVFGFSARESVHWIVPAIGAGIYLPGIFLLFQSILLYISTSYPPHLAASILAGNDLFRSTIASFFPLFGVKYFNGLTIAGGSGLLAGLSFIMVPVLYALMKFGPRLRARSKWIP